ncbi:hypothetical protein [Kitasatospora azatica]|uniref:hypothetical protein n=1 Tax=Kitasatospora azatica TaxID=58347 RepID=UPI000569A57E|nr:hypothetical protein [Kitasatospora azatica]
MSTDSAGAADDLADALREFADRAGGPGAAGAVWVTIGTPHDVEQRTVQFPVNVADWVTELVREETLALEAGTAGRDPGGGFGEVDDW